MESSLAIAQLVQSLDKSVQELSLARVEASKTGAHIQYAELTGRIETMRTVIVFFQQTAQPTPEAVSDENQPKKEAEKSKEAK